ncbi:MAG: phosphotransferase, partial [Halobacteriovoraceae bacterium]|nr:phosphotransferase [Halobacteriovoraceae bacterium]
PKEELKREKFNKNIFDKDKLQREVEFTYKHLIEQQMNNSCKKNKETILKGFKKINEELANEKMVVTHRDFHSRNIMVTNDELAVVDFQDAHLGIPQYDLVSLLEDSYYEPSRENRKLLKKYYWERSNILKKWQTKDNFEYFYDLSALQRVFKAMGSFSYLYLEKQKPFYLRHIGFAFEKIRHIFLQYPHFNEMRKRLAEIFYAN